MCGVAQGKESEERTGNWLQSWYNNNNSNKAVSWIFV